MHPLSTSNHNTENIQLICNAVVLHPLSTSNHNRPFSRTTANALYCILFLHQTTTSSAQLFSCTELYCILFLHQTTTQLDGVDIIAVLYCILFLHQTTTDTTITKYSRRCIASSFYIKPQPRTPDTLIFGHLTASRHDTKRGGVHRGSRFDAVFTFSTNIRKIIFTEIRRCMSVQRAGARLRSDSSEANI